MWSKGRVHVLPPTFVAMFLLYYFLQWFIYLLLKAPRSLRISCLFWCWPYPTLNWDISANENLCFEILIPLAAVLVISFHTCQEGGCILCFTTAVSLSWAAEPHYGSGFSWVIIPRFLFFFGSHAPTSFACVCWSLSSSEGTQTNPSSEECSGVVTWSGYSWKGWVFMASI